MALEADTIKLRELARERVGADAFEFCPAELQAVAASACHLCAPELARPGLLKRLGCSVSRRILPARVATLRLSIAAPTRLPSEASGV
jgi:hypothetical protein